MEWSAKVFRKDQPFGNWAEDLAAAFVQLEPRKIAETEVRPRVITRFSASRRVWPRADRHVARVTEVVRYLDAALEAALRSAAE
jgi:AraC family transcriptional regulator, positive regulator of tynA and feaB